MSTTPNTPATAVDRNLRKERIGIVTSDKMNKSIVVTVERRMMHPKYRKFVKKSSTFMAHDEKGKPISATPFASAKHAPSAN
jgi:ribosomal protein S17